jgi:hypothetical protein
MSAPGGCCAIAGSRGWPVAKGTSETRWARPATVLLVAVVTTSYPGAEGLVIALPDRVPQARPGPTTWSRLGSLVLGGLGLGLALAPP